jgi:D-serine deaminase-like pyridoxal phosphate-dependent protein
MSRVPAARATRRTFLAAGSLAAAHVWVPTSARGYTAAELRAMENTVGVSKWDLDTPALCVDLDALEANIASMQSRLAAKGLGARPHAKTHKSADIARKQIAAGALGICTSKVSEAETLMAAGIDRICMTTTNPSRSKIARAIALSRKSAHFVHAVDEEKNARDLADAAKAAGVVANVVVDVAVGTRSGIPAGEGAVALAETVSRLPSLKLRGMLSYDGGAQHVNGFAARRTAALANIEGNVKVYETLKRKGLPTEIFSGGGTGTYNIQHEVPGFTDVQVGSYVFMDMQYLAIGNAAGAPVYDDFARSLTVVATVLNNRFPGRLTTDAGAKALTLNTPRAGVVGEPDMEYNAGSDEFGVITVKAARKAYAIGDKLDLIVPHCDPVVNLYDQMYGIRKDRVEVVWPVTARGKSQ